MKNLLLVDDETNFLLSLADMFDHYSAEYNVFTATNGHEALEVIDHQEIDLVVTDLKMPELDGFALLARLSSSHPQLPVIVMTAFATPENTDKLDTLGLYQYIEKPIEFQDLLGKIKNALDGKSQGHVAGVSLASFLQLIGLDNKTCTLRITSDGKVGLFYFQDGELLDALLEDRSGEEAAIEISAWHPVEIDIEESCRKTEKVIESPLGFILIEGARRKDEQEETATKQQQTNTPPPAHEGDLFIDLAEPTSAEVVPQKQHVDIKPTTLFIEQALEKILGPVSAMIMRDTMASWEKSGSREAERLPELIDILCMEIGDSRLEISFRGAIKPALQKIGIQLPSTIAPTSTLLHQTGAEAENSELSTLLPQIKKVFTGTVGPIGDMLMKETIAKWSQHGPQSLSRLDELVDLLCTEIDDTDLEQFFRIKIAQFL